MLPSPDPLQDDHSALVSSIREIFDRSPLFRDARISDLHEHPEGRVSVEVRFAASPAFFHIVAPCAERAYAILYELAVSLVGVERAYTGVSNCQGLG